MVKQQIVRCVWDWRSGEREVAPMVNQDEGTLVSVKPQTIKPMRTVGKRKSRRTSS